MFGLKKKKDLIKSEQMTHMVIAQGIFDMAEIKKTYLY